MSNCCAREEPTASVTSAVGGRDSFADGQRRWRFWSLIGSGRFLFLVGLMSIVLLANPQVIADLRTYSFDDGTYAHAYLVPLVILYLLARAEAHRWLEFRWQPIAFVVMVILLLLQAIFIIAQYAFLMRLIFPLVVLAAACSLIRPHRGLVVPILFLWFITPIWGPINPILRHLSVAATNFIMSLTSIPAIIESEYDILIPAGRFHIASGCSGLRYFIVSVFIACLYSHLSLERLRDKVKLFLASAISGMLTNWIRIVLIMLIGHYTNMQSPILSDHNMLGWYVYIPFVVLLRLYTVRLEKRADEHHPCEEKPAAGEPVGLYWRGALAVCCALLTISGSAINLLSGNRYELGTPMLASSSWQNASPWRTPDQAFAFDPAPVVHWPSEVRTESLDVGGRRVVARHYYFNGRHDGNKADYYLNRITPPGWHVIKTISLKDSTVLLVRSRDKEYGAIRYWYQIGRWKTPSRSQLRLYRLFGALILNQKTELHWYFTPCKGEETESALGTLQEA